MGLVLMSVGTFFTYHLWDSFQRSEETRHWLETPCEIITSPGQYHSARQQLDGRIRGVRAVSL